MYEMDQSAYLDYAKKLSQTGYKYVGGRNRMPFYPVLLSLFYEDGMSDEDYFERGKKVSVAIGIIGLFITYLIFNRVSHSLEAATGTLVAAFTVFVYKAPYFQAEVLFYIIGLFLFSLLVSFVKKKKRQGDGELE